MILTPSLYVFVAEIQRLIADGYEVDFENNPPITWGIAYECGMIKADAIDAHAGVFLQKPETTVGQGYVAPNSGAFASTVEPHVKPLAPQRGRPKQNLTK